MLSWCCLTQAQFSSIRFHQLRHVCLLTCAMACHETCDRILLITLHHRCPVQLQCFLTVRLFEIAGLHSICTVLILHSLCVYFTWSCYLYFLKLKNLIYGNSDVNIFHVSAAFGVSSCGMLIIMVLMSGCHRAYSWSFLGGSFRWPGSQHAKQLPCSSACWPAWRHVPWWCPQHAASSDWRWHDSCVQRCDNYSRATTWYWWPAWLQCHATCQPQLLQSPQDESLFHCQHLVRCSLRTVCC